MSTLTLLPKDVAVVVAKFGSSPNASPSSCSVSKVAGAEPTKFDTAVLTKAVVAILVLLLPADCVGAVGLPVSAGPVSYTHLTLPTIYSL